MNGAPGPAPSDSDVKIPPQKNAFPQGRFGDRPSLPLPLPQIQGVIQKNE
jgi:hypothetical protein